jgi:hypothetical protein
MALEPAILRDRYAGIYDFFNEDLLSLSPDYEPARKYLYATGRPLAPENCGHCV